jgi:glucosylceramidase
MKKPRIFLSAENIRFEEQAEHFAKTYTRSEGDVSAWGENIIIRPDEEYQEIHGFGASFTDSAAIAMSAMPQDKLSDAMTKLFDKEDGIGLSLVRNCLGGPDITPVYYTYDDMPEGEED